MILHYAGKYDGDEAHLPQREHHPNAVPFKEAKNMKRLAVTANVGATVTMILFAIPLFLLGKRYDILGSIWLPVGAIGSLLTLFPHELLHGLCFKKDVYMYTNLSQGMLFVVGTEDMSKWRFILMSLCPNIVFGFVPYIAFLIFPQLIGLGVLGVMCIGMGFGDYINVFNALTQMPKNSKTYLCGMHSYWYLP